jgi:hypothetical protein
MALFGLGRPLARGASEYVPGPLATMAMEMSWNVVLLLAEMSVPPSATMLLVDDATSRQVAAPEDCGGPHSYAQLLEALRDPTHERDDELLEWVGEPFDPDAFDAAAIHFDDPKERWKTAFEKSAE